MERVISSQLFLLCIFIIIILQLKVVNTYAQGYPKGQVTDTVWCAHDSTQTYSLYLPSYYDPQHQWPVIIIFEPAARGELPVSKFKPGAEELGYILVGSNNSRNGSWEVAFDAADAMFLDVFNKFSIDPERVYVSGFSGGSRIATSVAVITGRIAGVIACGAGYPNVSQYQPSAKSKFVYCALVGNQDMNYQEHLKVADDLNEKGITNNLITFPNGHQWPPASFLKESLYWLEFQAYKKKMKTSPFFSIKKAFHLVKNRADSIYQVHDMVEALRVYRSLEENFRGHFDLMEVNQLILSIEENKDYKKQQRNSEKTSDLEMEYRFVIGEAFTELIFTRFKTGNDSTLKNMDWWKNEIDGFKRLSQKKDIYKSNMALRILNMIWARSAETSFTYAARQDYELAIILNEIWLYVEPESTWGHWSLAKLFAQTGDIERVVKHLEAVKKYRNGIPLQIIKRDTAFTHMLDHEKIRNLLK
ncbi:hypothetical protein LVD17_10955 [Fulvivirga ulvae]|uniref:hypothetical protein n=1 Tax=Fulvivirga ulvae TaxID=2904245 RepID=UPI001F38D103|nr:hypothetical protein [Fulvivirga ulvae]UII34327.1 hypothetical protein LVD17_10955 [Fulvivirga ulvae]